MSIQEISPNQPARELVRCLQGSGRAHGPGRSPASTLRLVEVDELTIRRRRNGHGFLYLAPTGRPIREQRVLSRLKGLAVPPAYEDVYYAACPASALVRQI